MRKRLLLPAALGLGLGAVMLTLQVVTGIVHVLTAALNVPSINVAFPGSIVFYSGGAIILEAIWALSTTFFQRGRLECATMGARAEQRDARPALRGSRWAWVSDGGGVGASTACGPAFWGPELSEGRGPSEARSSVPSEA